MIYRQISNTKIPALGFGTFELKKRTCIDSVLNALEIGYRHIDTAEMYGNESEVGEALQSSHISREDLFITSKVWHDHLKSEHMHASIEKSLEKLNTDHLDLYLIHWPPTDGTPIERALETLNEIKDKGLTKHIGVSNFTPEMLKTAANYGISNIQVEYHPFLNQDELLSLARQHNLIFTAYSPIAHGKVFENETIKSLADKYVKTPSQITLRWLLQQDNVMAIPRSSKKDHIRNNFEIFDFELEEDDMQKIYELEGDRRLVDPEFAPNW